ncbi:MAG: type II toxin-antitoxin system PemK/MazF family toxin [Longispora sp.]|nr:type II toxin-antitoxin system PemK/MazF family toxin [Longispora sp. (in: high G+C Gram-positive bacteria)]
MGRRVKRGTILQYAVGGQRLRVVVLTADRYNPAHALIAPLRERTPPEQTPAFLVPLTRADWPTAAVIDLTRTRALDPAAITGDAGKLTPDTTALLNTAVRTYLGART